MQTCMSAFIPKKLVWSRGEQAHIIYSWTVGGASFVVRDRNLVSVNDIGRKYRYQSQIFLLKPFFFSNFSYFSGEYKFL